MTRKEIATEMLTNCDLTKEQYLAFCELYDELGLEKEVEEEDEWAKILGMSSGRLV